ncbi:SNF2-related protein [Craterilacuibacter sp.]|uniref:SNF2-related protein n=1 Tax=Craterilacuibacter sp. TaxID=2870909 RepID=UPI003F30B969
MATRQTYGNTWWGAAWLGALTHIDFDNRLPRGRSYANKGSVQQLVIQQGEIRAKVAGSRPSPYRVKIATPAVNAASIEGLLDDIAADPLLIARILNRELDPAILDLALARGIWVFPDSWKKLEMHCSCPDWAVPCKHLAAAIYLLSREIDSNPFLVFSLRGIDLVKGLKARGMDIGQAANAALPDLATLLHALAEHESVNTDAVTESAVLDFSRIPEQGDALLRVLPESPAFFASGDFRAQLHKLLSRAAQAASKQLDTEPKASASVLHPSDRPQLLLDKRAHPVLTGLAQLDQLSDLLNTVSCLPKAELADYQPALAAFSPLKQFVLNLLARGALVPQLFAADKKTVGLLWLPAIQDATVRGLLQELADNLPAGLLQLKQAGQSVRLSPMAQAQALCALLLTHYVHTLCALDKEKNAADKTLQLFFGSGLACYDASGETAIAAGIQAWLARLVLAQQNHVPVLCLDEDAEGDFSLTLAVQHVGSPVPHPLSEILTEPAWQELRFGILQAVSLLAGFYPPLHAYVRGLARTPLRISAGALPDLLFDVLPLLRLLGIRVLLPKALQHLLRPRLSMRIKARTDDSPGSLSPFDMFDFDWQIAIGDALISRAEFEQLISHAAGVVRFRGAYVYLDAAEIEHLRAQLARPIALQENELLQVALTGEYEGASIQLDADVQQCIADLLNAGDVPVPDVLQADLRPYQLRGYAWLYRNACLGLGSVIADDMGLGKTLQVIAAIQKLQQEGALVHAKVLVVMPTSLLTNWQKEIARFAPTLSVGVFHGTKRELAQQRPDVLLTSYGVARSAAAALKALAWQLLIVDEAQNIKNSAAAQTRALKSIPAKSFIAVSGTPVENRLSEYWSIMDFANRGYLGKLASFVRDYAKPIQLQHDQQALARFKRMTAPFLLRRLKTDRSIISDLPDKIEQDQYCALGKTQAALYESVLQAAMQTLSGEEDSFKRQGLVLQMMMALKQVCNHPAQYLKQDDGDALQSGKVERLFELLNDIHASHEKVLIFTQFKTMGLLLANWIAERTGQRPQFLHGACSRAQRDAMVERFQHDRTERVFILSLKAGGTGLNLTAASHVIHFDLWWNPAVEAQATDRAYRIGQQRNVQVHRLICRGTFEERINDMIRSKRELADLTLSSGETWIGHLASDEIRELFALNVKT